MSYATGQAELSGIQGRLSTVRRSLKWDVPVMAVGRAVAALAFCQCTGCGKKYPL